MYSTVEKIPSEQKSIGAKCFIYIFVYRSMYILYIMFFLD